MDRTDVRNPTPGLLSRLLREGQGPSCELEVLRVGEVAGAADSYKVLAATHDAFGRAVQGESAERW